ncbi:hypothetical protein ACJJTC_008046 [Scirpophaga incertulas]
MIYSPKSFSPLRQPWVTVLLLMNRWWIPRECRPRTPRGNDEESIVEQYRVASHRAHPPAGSITPSAPIALIMSPIVADDIPTYVLDTAQCALRRLCHVKIYESYFMPLPTHGHDYRR